MKKATYKLPEDLLDEIKETALRLFYDDAQQDPRYAMETVGHLAEEANKDIGWWLEFLSSDTDVYEGLLGFNPLRAQAEGGK